MPSPSGCVLGLLRALASLGKAACFHSFIKNIKAQTSSWNYYHGQPQGPQDTCVFWVSGKWAKERNNRTRMDCRTYTESGIALTAGILVQVRAWLNGVVNEHFFFVMCGFRWLLAPGCHCISHFESRYSVPCCSQGSEFPEGLCWNLSFPGTCMIRGLRMKEENASI